MNVYDTLLKETLEVLRAQPFRELSIRDSSWNMLDSNEFLMGREVRFELGDRFRDSVVSHIPTSDPDLVGEDRIFLLGPDLPEIRQNTNFSRITLFNIDDIKDPNKAYIGVRKLNYERYKIIPEGYMILSSSFENKENVRVSKKAVKQGLNFEILGNLYRQRYHRLPGVNHVQVYFIVGDYDFVPQLVALSRKVNEVTQAFDHILKNVILDCDVCPLKTICEDIEALRKLHFDLKAESPVLSNNT